MTSAALTSPSESGSARGGRGWLVAAVAVVVLVISLVCAWALYHELHPVIGRRAFAWGLLFAFVPVVPLAGLFVWLDRLRPEPRWLLIVTFVFGALAATFISLQLNGWLAGLIGDRSGPSPRSAVFIAPWVEEAAKATIIFAIVLWRRHDFNAVVAGVVYGGLAGVGFAFTENIFYYGQIFQQAIISGESSATALDGVQDLFLFRGLAAPFVHPMFTLVTGVGIGLAVRHRHLGVRIVAPVAGYCGAVVLHMGYNTIASFATSDSLAAVYFAILLPTLAALVTIVIVVRRHERRVIAARLHDYTVFGWLKAAHVPFIVSGRGRRRARRYARRFGKAESQRLRGFQRAGLDLGLLRDRLVRGVAGPSELPREGELIAMLTSLRGKVLLPGVSEASNDELSSAASSW
ncbi:MAG: PrsW family intramembrane metalloprotease [Propionibacteriales bacterium]|nr:PrsW family intramembrane metalloprotease [Propionibacteriales bacterium]